MAAAEVKFLILVDVAVRHAALQDHSQHDRAFSTISSWFTILTPCHWHNITCELWYIN